MADDNQSNNKVSENTLRDLGFEPFWPSGSKSREPFWRHEVMVDCEFFGTPTRDELLTKLFLRGMTEGKKLLQQQLRANLGIYT